MILASSPYSYPSSSSCFLISSADFAERFGVSAPALPVPPNGCRFGPPFSPRRARHGQSIVLRGRASWYGKDTFRARRTTSGERYNRFELHLRPQDAALRHPAAGHERLKQRQVGGGARDPTGGRSATSASSTCPKLPPAPWMPSSSAAAAIPVVAEVVARRPRPSARPTAPRPTWPPCSSGRPQRPKRPSPPTTAGRWT